MATAGDVLRFARMIFRASSSMYLSREDERRQAEELLGFVLGHDPDPDEELDRATLRRVGRLVDRRAAGEPMAHLTGFVTFMDMTLRVPPGTFSPRASSAFLVRMALRRLRRRRLPIHIDLGTGVGPIALAVARSLKPAKVYGVDISAEAARAARRNAREFAIGNVRFLQGDLFAPVPKRIRGHVGVVTSHLPYVRPDELEWLLPEVRREPLRALTDGSPLGLRVLERSIREAGDWLHPGGWMLAQVTSPRSRAVAAALRQSGYRDVEILKPDVPEWRRYIRVVAGKR